MAMVIQHNIPALQTYNIVNNTSNALQKSIAKLSSGLRINSAADDAAGLAISEKMRAQIRGLDRAAANTQDGISLIQTAEGALSETHSILQRMRELSVQAANDTLTQQDRSYIQVEVDQLKEEITRIGNTTQFNKKKLLNGESAALWSSDDLETKAIINGGLRDVDQFGQKKSVEGNYKIRVKADPGQGEVQKSDIMKVKHENVVMNKTVNNPKGVVDVSINDMAAGHYNVKSATAEAGADATITGSYAIGGDLTTCTTGVAFQELTGDVTKVSVQTTDGTELWSMEGSKVIAGTGYADADANKAAQKKFFDTTHKDEIVRAAAQKGVTLDLADATSWKTQTLNGEAPGIKIVYTTSGASTTQPVSTLTAPSSATKVTADDVFAVKGSDKNFENVSILFEVTGMDYDNKAVTLKATATKLSQNGVNSTASMDNIVVSESDTTAIDLSGLGTGLSVKFKNGAGDFAQVGGVGGKFVASVAAGKENGDNTNQINITLDGTLDNGWDDAWENGPFGKTAAGASNTVNYFMNGDAMADTEVTFKNYILNEKTGDVKEGSITLTTNDQFKSTANGGQLADDLNLASFDAAYIGKVAQGDVKLRDLDKFWNSEGTFMLDDAKTLTLNQGDGKTANITLYANDTLNDVAKKINDAIGVDLGQSQYVDDASNFATFVSGSTHDSESVDGTFVIRSVVPGKSGEITFSGDEGVINALSLNTIQKSEETKYTVDVLDSHTGDMIAQGVKTTGNVLHGVIHDNVDVEFSALGGVNAKWNDSLKKFTYDSVTKETTLHLADNTTVLQIGANEGEDLGMNIGDMRAHALGLDGVNVMSHDRAARSITLIDNAIDKVSTQRANLGAYQNRLEATARNLTTASENLTASESRIRDTDMAKEMMEFTKLNIMLQAGNSMLAQANQQPQNVLSLIR